ncbi:hypothetical protein [Modestobacter sp. VKM Ac-2985]|uniref:hypothetical protein n=1 Tax=Modestobacter sp. VKM Ac-2985 TaxID=3004139 RepID=UPI0022AB8EB8|nr:hypothetical protein [Modestobacter sp. VKM Ac-2985]MCZ2837138.1 hypothetical protein [Modestobacter sp. VKM Ac-2985]
MSFVISHPSVEGTQVIPEHTLPTYAARGWVLTGRDTDPAAAPAPKLEQPNKSATAAEWKTYAVALPNEHGGLDYETAMTMTRDELAEHYNPTPKPETPAKTTSRES